MHFQCVDNALQRVDNALQRVDNGSQLIFNVNQSIEETLTMFDKIEEWLKNASKRVGNFFQRLIQMPHETLKTRDNVSPRCNKAPQTVNTTNSLICLHATY